MLTSTLPEFIKPIKLARQELLLRGEFPLCKMIRLTDNTFSKEGVVIVDVMFTRDGEGYPLMQGTVKTCVELQCQRCLESAGVDLEINLSLAFVTRESKLEQMPGIYEAVLLESEEISLIELLEDELILAMPIVAFHDECKAYQYRSKAELESEKIASESERENPFDVLKQLKATSNKPSN